MSEETNTAEPYHNAAQPQRSEQQDGQLINEEGIRRFQKHATWQEWTPETVRQFWRENQKKKLCDDEQWNTFFQSAAAAHNAALTAEREEVRIMTNQCVQLRQELTAERQRRESIEVILNNVRAAADSEHQQLLSALAVIEDCKTELEVLEYNITNKQWEFAKANVKSAARRLDVDLSLLHEHDA
jgi:hypothetical protein